MFLDSEICAAFLPVDPSGLHNIDIVVAIPPAGYVEAAAITPELHFVPRHASGKQKECGASFAEIKSLRFHLINSRADGHGKRLLASLFIVSNQYTRCRSMVAIRESTNKHVNNVFAKGVCPHKDDVSALVHE